MSVKLMAMVFDLQALTPTEKSVLLAMADNAWDDGTSCYPSRGRLEHKTSLSHATVDRALRTMRQAGWIMKTGETDMGVVEWTIDVAKVAMSAEPYEPARPYTQSEYTPTLTVSVPPTQSEYQTVSEPTYIDDKDGVPDELMMEWDTFLKGWAHYFPNKTQPRPTNANLIRKFKTRMKNTDWRSNWKQAVKTASQWQWAQNEGWFKAEWILHNDDNIFKLLDGTFNFKLNQPLTPAPTSSKIDVDEYAKQMNAWKNRRTK